MKNKLFLNPEILANLFSYFLENRAEQLSKEFTYALKTYYNNKYTYLVVHAEKSSLTKTLLDLLSEQSFKSLNIAYNVIDSPQGVFLNCVFLGADEASKESFMQALTAKLDEWQIKLNERQVLRIALENSAVSLDPRIGGENVSGGILRLLFEGLTRINEKNDLENAVAEFIEISSDRKQYTFRLRNTFWNNGLPVSAFDFEYAWKKILSPDFKTSFAYLFYPIKNAKAAKEGHVSLDHVGIHALDDRTLIVELENPTAYFLQLTTLPLYSPVHRLTDQEHPQWPYQSEKNYPCNGPYKLMINQPNQGYQLVKNESYWDNNNIKFEEINFSIMNHTQAIQAISKNEIHWFGNPFASWNASESSDTNSKVHVFHQSLLNCWFVFNVLTPPFNNKKVRQAFSYAIRRNELISGPLSSLNPTYSFLEEPYTEMDFPTTDEDKARQLFEEGLHELGLKKKDVQKISLVCQEQGTQRYAAQCLKEQFKKCFNIECEILPMLWNEHFNKMTKSQFQTGLMYWKSYTKDSAYTLSAFKSKEDVNFAKWENAEFKHLIDRSEQEIDHGIRIQLLRKAKNVLCEEMPVVPLFSSPSQALISKNLFVPPTGYNIITKSYFQKEN